MQTTIAEKTLSQASLAEPSPIVDSMSKLHIDDKKPKVEATTFNTDEHTDGSTAAKKAPGVPALTDSSKAQIDVRDPEDPLAHPGKAEQRQNVDDKAGLDVDADPVKIEGPGPKPLEQVAKEHGGDAGAIDSKPVGTAPEPQQESGGTHDDETGKLHVRASGFSADGGDFDASKPGAAAEADRECCFSYVEPCHTFWGLTRSFRLTGLKEVKEQSPENHESHAKSTGSGLHGLHLPHHKQEDESATKEKVSLKEKIKAKLHKS